MNSECEGLIRCSNGVDRLRGNTLLEGYGKQDYLNLDLNCVNCSLQEVEKRCYEGLFCSCLGFHVLKHLLSSLSGELGTKWHLVCPCIGVLDFK